MINTSTGKNVQEFRSSDDKHLAEHETRRVLLPHLLLIATQLPLVAIYLWGLWIERTHYVWMPLAFVATAGFLFLRWPRAEEPAFFPSYKSDFFLICGIILSVLATFLLSPWFGFASFLCLFASLLARTNDRGIFGTLTPALAPLVVLLHPPLAIDFDTVNGDFELMSFIDVSATRIASGSLDILQYVHNVSGTRMELPVGVFDATTLGNSSHSVFTLLIFTGVYIAWLRRPLFRAAMLLVAACFWFISAEAIELLFCSIAQSSFEKDYYSPGSSGTLQLQGFLGAAAMTLLSDRLIAFLFGPVDISAIDQDVSYQDMICKFWNRAISGITSPIIDVNIKKEVAWAKRRNSNPPANTIRFVWMTTIGLAVLAALSTIGILSAWNKSKDNQLKSLTSDQGITATAFPNNLDGFQQVSFENVTANPSTPFDDIKNQWIYRDSDGTEYQVNVLHTFTGWHDYQLRQRSFDWKLNETPLDEEFELDDGQIPYRQLSYRNNFHEFRTLYYCQFDGFGEAFAPPKTWRSFSAFSGRLFSRLGNRTRPRLFSNHSMVVAVTLDSIGPHTQESTVLTGKLFQAVTKHLSKSIKSGSFTETL